MSTTLVCGLILLFILIGPSLLLRAIDSVLLEKKLGETGNNLQFRETSFFKRRFTSFLYSQAFDSPMSSSGHGVFQKSLKTRKLVVECLMIVLVVVVAMPVFKGAVVLMAAAKSGDSIAVGDFLKFLFSGF